jgi:hypothetical protein
VGQVFFLGSSLNGGKGKKEETKNQNQKSKKINSNKSRKKDDLNHAAVIFILIFSN